jgi:hypothetical protein
MKTILVLARRVRLSIFREAAVELSQVHRVSGSRGRVGVLARPSYTDFQVRLLDHAEEIFELWVIHRGTKR